MVGHTAHLPASITYNKGGVKIAAHFPISYQSFMGSVERTTCMPAAANCR